VCRSYAASERVSDINGRNIVVCVLVRSMFMALGRRNICLI
jgi:hypothetical protein